MSTLQSDVSKAFKAAALSQDDLLLLACSGGKDSMVLLHILLELGYRPAVAHVNFQLRGADSEADECFVGDFCAEKGLSFYSTRFQTEVEADEHKESIQMAARRLRYAWLFSLMDELGTKRLLTAHHERDQAETMLLNLMRGTGPQGLQGMLVDDGRLMRPMLRSSYEEIDRLAKAQEIQFREDRSNASTKYKRNFIRHTLLTPWEEAYPGTVRQFSRSSEIMEEVNEFLQTQFEEVAKKYVQIIKGETQISFSIKEHLSARLLLRHILKSFEMEDQAAFILETVGRPGAIFSSPSHVLLADRDWWLVKAKEGKVKKAKQLIPLLAERETSRSFHFGDYRFELSTIIQQGIWPGNSSSILLKKSLLEEGCYFRVWQEGDRMQPFGMKGKKKLSDVFIDAKIDLFQKANWPLFCDAKGEILWVAGIRSAEGLRIDSLDQADFDLTLLP